MAVQNATNVTLSVGGNPISFSTSCSLSISREVRDATNKYSGGFTNNLEGVASWEVSGDGFVDLADSTSNKKLSDLFSLMNASPVAAVEVIFTIGASGDTYTGNAYITSLSADAGFEDNTTYSVTCTGTGTLTQSVAT